jgi:hypothetical protein
MVRRSLEGQVLSRSHDGTCHPVFRRPVPSAFEVACSQGRTAPEVTLRGTLGPLRALARKS